MPYIGNTAANRFVASKSASVFSGDGSTTAFTLDHGVGSDEDILVSVDGVIQEPSVAYSVSGTTLTFTSAPSNNSGNNIFVYYLFRTVGTVSHPSSNALQATSGTFTGDVTIGDASASDKKILFDGNAQDFHIGLDDSNDSLTIGLGSALGTTSHMVIDANGHVTKPLQSAFQAQPSQQQANIANAATIEFGTEIFDQNADFASHTFTAPVTGKYQLNVNLRVDNLSVTGAWNRVELVTSNNTYSIGMHDSAKAFNESPGEWFFAGSVTADMDSNDTAFLRWSQSGGGSTADIEQGSIFSGFLAC